MQMDKVTKRLNCEELIEFNKPWEKCVIYLGKYWNKIVK